MGSSVASRSSTTSRSGRRCASRKASTKTSLWVLSKFTLLNQAERLGLFATVWLGATLVWLVVSLPLGEVGPEALLRSRLTSSAR